MTQQSEARRCATCDKPADHPDHLVVRRGRYHAFVPEERRTGERRVAMGGVRKDREREDQTDRTRSCSDRRVPETAAESYYDERFDNETEASATTRLEAESARHRAWAMAAVEEWEGGSLVERLAAKARVDGSLHLTRGASLSAARFFLRAIAEEIEAETNEIRAADGELPVLIGFREVVTLLRTEADR